MRIDPFHIQGIRAVESPDDPPVCPNGHGPLSAQVDLERMKAETRQVHLLRATRSIQNGQDVLHFRQHVGAHAALVVSLKQRIRLSVSSARSPKATCAASTCRFDASTSSTPTRGSRSGGKAHI
jgi:hypothetical protein